MSLLSDAFLFELASFEVWIALRGDGGGSGKQSDPWDGSTLKTAPLSITLSIPDPTHAPLQAQATTASAHGFSAGDLIVIESPGSLEALPWDGWGIIDADDLTSTSFKFTLKKAPPSGSPPTDRVVQKILKFRLDERLHGLPERTRIHIGPGILDTRGGG